MHKTPYCKVSLGASEKEVSCHSARNLRFHQLASIPMYNEQTDENASSTPCDS